MNERDIPDVDDSNMFSFKMFNNSDLPLLVVAVLLRVAGLIVQGQHVLGG